MSMPFALNRRPFELDERNALAAKAGCIVLGFVTFSSRWCSLQEILLQNKWRTILQAAAAAAAAGTAAPS